MKIIVFLFFLNFWFSVSGFTQNTDSLLSAINAIQVPVSLNMEDREDVRSMKLLREAQIIGLGEATHGTHEFLVYKTKLVRYLIEELGARLILFEIDFGESVVLNECISDINCDLHENIKKMQYYVWKTSEVESLFQWIREFNLRNPADQVVVLGVDCLLPRKNLDLIEDFSKLLTVKNAEKIRTKLIQLRNMQFDLNKRNTAIKFQNKVDELAIFITDNDQEYKNSLSKSQYILLGQALSTLKQCVSAADTSYNNRDYLMAENVEILKDLLGSKKTIFWAHNIHVANYQSYRPEKFTKNTVGYYLKSRHGVNYVGIGFGFSKGTFSAFSFDEKRVTMGLEIYEPPKLSSLNYLCHHSKYAKFYLPLYKIKGKSALGLELSKPMDFLHITSSFKEEWRKNLYIGKIHLLDYDYLVYFNNTSHSQIIGVN